jgi:hypothetical protein
MVIRDYRFSMHSHTLCHLCCCFCNMLLGSLNLLMGAGHVVALSLGCILVSARAILSMLFHVSNFQ